MDMSTGSLLQFIPAFMSLMKGMDNSGQKQTAAQLSNVNNAMTNPNNPLYQQMYGQYKQQGQQALGDSISQMEGQNRMLSSMGRTPLFDPSRQGEQTFRAQAAAGPQIGIQAGQQTQQALQNAAASLGGKVGQTGVYQNLFNSQYGSRAGTQANPYGQGAANQTGLGLGQLGQFLNSGQGGGQQPRQLPWQTPNQGLNAPGAQQGNSILDMLKGMF
jgi:hypothetical protein